jgi:hypothetical protein
VALLVAWQVHRWVRRGSSAAPAAPAPTTTVARDAYDDELDAALEALPDS